MAVAGAVILSGAAAFAPAYAESGTCPAGSLRDTYTNTIAECGVKEDDENRDLSNVLNTVLNVIIFIVGFLAVVMIILGGITYTTSAGDASKVKKAKDTIMYGIIGLVIAILAFAIVNFVISNLFG